MEQERVRVRYTVGEVYVFRVFKFVIEGKALVVGFLKPFVSEFTPVVGH